MILEITVKLDNAQMQTLLAAIETMQKRKKNRKSKKGLKK